MTLIESLLTRNGPMLSGDLAKLIAEERSISSEAARKYLSRYQAPVKRITGFLINNQSFFYLQAHAVDGSYSKQLLYTLRTSAKRLFVLIKALQYNKGFLPEKELMAYMFSPVNNLVGHKRADIVIQEAMRLNLIIKENELYKLSPAHFLKKDINFKYYKAIDIARRFLLDQFTDWAKMIGLVSFEKAELFREFSKFQWAFTAPSYVGTLVDYHDRGHKPAFVIADILIGGDTGEDQIYFFIEKIKTIKALKSGTNIIPFLIVDSVPKEAFNVLKQYGVVIGLISKLFGTGYSDLIKTLIKTVANAGAILKKNPEAFFELMEKIRVLTDGKTNNLRGDVFELAVGYYHARRCRSIDISKNIYVDGRPYELDVFSNYSDAIIVSECKGVKRQVTLEEIDKWLKKNADTRKWIDIQEEYNNKPHVFEYWSTGGFTKEALAKLKEAGKTKRYQILYFDQNKILSKAKEIPNSKFVTILKQYFINEQL